MYLAGAIQVACSSTLILKNMVDFFTKELSSIMTMIMGSNNNLYIHGLCIEFLSVKGGGSGYKLSMMNGSYLELLRFEDDYFYSFSYRMIQ